ncbi:MAG TPA: hypothetical protein VHY79_09585 [Rhizomicrobium sp.]|nr:hypothetical protein [Rhizomicrobium sp.]
MRIDVAFISIGLVILFFGMAFGMWMGARQAFQYADAHAHLNLLGFVVPSIYGLLHRAYPDLARSRLAWPQCAAHFLGVLIFVPGIVIVTRTGNPACAIAGGVLVMLATLAFVFIFLTAGKSRQPVIAA